MKDFDEKVISKLCLLVDNYGTNEALSMMAHLEHRMRTKQVRPPQAACLRGSACWLLQSGLLVCSKANEALSTTAHLEHRVYRELSAPSQDVLSGNPRASRVEAKRSIPCKQCSSIHLLLYTIAGLQVCLAVPGGACSTRCPTLCPRTPPRVHVGCDEERAWLPGRGCLLIHGRPEGGLLGPAHATCCGRPPGRSE